MLVLNCIRRSLTAWFPPWFLWRLKFLALLLVVSWLCQACGSEKADVSQRRIIIQDAETIRQEKEIVQRQLVSAQQELDTTKRELSSLQGELKQSQHEEEQSRKEVIDAKKEIQHSQNLAQSTQQQSAFMKGSAVAGAVTALLLGVAMGSKARRDSVKTQEVNSSEKPVKRKTAPIE